METSVGAATVAAGADATETMPNAQAMTVQTESLTLNIAGQWRDRDN